MAAAAVSIDPSLYHHSHHHYSPYSQQQQRQHHSLSALQHHHAHQSSSQSSPSAASVASLASALGVSGGGAGNGLGLLSGMNAHSVNAIAAFHSQASTPMHANAAAQSHHNGGFPSFSAAASQSSFVPLYPPLYPMAQAAAVPITSSSSLSLSASSSSNFSMFPAGNATTSLSAWPPASASFPSSSHISRVVTPDSSPSTPTHFNSSASAWSDRLMPLTAHTFNMQHSSSADDYPMSVKDDNSSSAHDGLSVHSGVDKDDLSAVSSSHMLLTRSSQSVTRQLPPQVRDHASRRRSSSNTSAMSGGSVLDDKQLEALLKSIRLSVAKMDELIASSPAGLSTASTASTASTSSTSSTPSTSPVFRPSGTAALEDIKALLVNAANAVSTGKKRKSVDESVDGVDSPMKRRLTADEEEEEGEEAAEGAFAVQEVNGNGMPEDDDEDDDAGAADDDDSPRTQCKPCPLVESINKKPLKVLYVNVQRQYTVSKKETVRMSKDDKERLVPVHVRIMGTPARGELYFVAKDVCLLIHTRKGNVAKSIGQFREDEKVRMSVVCPRSNGTVSTHILTALTVKGVKRLLTTSRSPLASHVLKWIMKQVDVIMTEYAEEKKARQMKKMAAAAASATQQQQKETAAVAVRKSSQDSASSQGSFNSNKTSPSASPASGLMVAPVVPLAPLSPLEGAAVAPLMPQEPSPIVKPSPVNYRLSPSSSATPSHQLSVMVGQQQLLSQPDRKTGSSLPNSPTRTSPSLPSSLAPSAPSTPTSGGRSTVGTPSPSTAVRSAFSKVPSFTADADGKKSEAVEVGRVSPIAEKTVADGTAPAATGVKTNAKLTSLLEAIKVQNVDGKQA